MEYLRVIIHLHSAYWCQVDVEHASAGAVLADITRRFPEAEGYSLQVQHKTGERRLLESTPAGIRLLYAEGCFASR